MAIDRRLLTVCLSVCALWAALLGGSQPLSAQDSVKSVLDEGLSLFNEREFSGARGKFEQAFAMNPSSDAILDFVERATVSEIFHMIRSGDASLAGIGRQLLEIAEGARTALISDPAEIQAAIEQVMDAEDEQERLILQLQATGKYGRNLVPALIPYLGDPDVDRRRNTAINWIPRIGRDSVPALQAARLHSNVIIRQNVASLLGRDKLRHSFALATLKAMAETDESPEVRAAAEDSYEATLADLNGGRRGDAKTLFVANAVRYSLMPEKNPFAQNYAVPVVYSLKGDQVVSQRVAEFQVSDFMAKLALEEALQLDPGYKVAHEYLAYNDGAILAEYDANVAYYAERGDDSGIKEVLAAQQPYIEYVLRNRLRAAPGPVLYAALKRALRDRRPGAALKLIETISATGRAAPRGSLLEALSDSNSRLVRVAAASAIAYSNPRKSFDDSKLVAETLVQAALSSGVRTGLRVMGNDRTARSFGKILRDLNMESYSAVSSIEEGYESSINAPPDVILIDQEVSQTVDSRDIAPINHFVTLLRRNYRTANVPVLVVASDVKAAEDMYASEERKVMVIPASIQPAQLQSTVLDPLFADADDAKSRATALAGSAAEAIKFLTAVRSPISLKSHIGALTRTLVNRPDNVRAPCIHALGMLRATEAAGALAQVFQSEDNALQVRVAAMQAVGMVLDGSGAPEAVAKIISDGMQSNDLNLRAVSWFAFSNSGASGDDRYQAYLAEAPAMAGAAGAEADVDADADLGDDADEEDTDADVEEDTDADFDEEDADSEDDEELEEDEEFDDDF